MTPVYNETGQITMTMLTLWGSSQGSYLVSPHPPPDNHRDDDDDDDGNHKTLEKFR